jgi:hypothetical protein
VGLYRVPLQNGIQERSASPAIKKPGDQVRRAQDLISAYSIALVDVRAEHIGDDLVEDCSRERTFR